MGWTEHKLPTPGWYLYTRGGTDGVFIQRIGKDGKPDTEEVQIPSEMIRMMVAEEIRNERISRLEQMDVDEILNEIRREG